MKDHDPSKRTFIKAAAYVAPVVLTMNAHASWSGSGSGYHQCDRYQTGKNEVGDQLRPQGEQTHYNA